MAFTDDFADEVRLHAKLPDTGSFTDAEIYDFANDVILERITPAIRAVREDYFVVDHDVTLVVGTSSYRIPTRSVSGTVRDVVLVMTDGREVPLAEIPLDRAWSVYQTQQGDPEFYRVTGDRVHLYPTPGRALTLRVRYERRPAKIVPTSECAQISGVSDSSPTYTVSCAVPANFPSSGSNGIFDVVQEFAGFDVPLLDAFGEVSGSSILFTVTLGSYAAASANLVDMAADLDLYGASVEGRRYYVCEADTTCIIPVPTNAYSAVVKLTAALCLDAEGDRQGAATLEAKGSKGLANFIRLVDPRNAGRDKRVVPQFSVYGRPRVRF